MNSWILGIVGVAFLGVMLEVVIPEGKTNVFIKSIFSLMFIFVVMSPIINLVKSSNIDISGIFGQYDDDYYEHSSLEIKSKIENQLKQNGIEGVFVEIDGYMSNNDLVINRLYVNLSNMVINERDEHIDKYKLITGLIMEVVKVSEENIVYG